MIILRKHIDNSLGIPLNATRFTEWCATHRVKRGKDERRRQYVWQRHNLPAAHLFPLVLHGTAHHSAANAVSGGISNDDLHYPKIQPCIEFAKVEFLITHYEL